MGKSSEDKKPSNWPEDIQYLSLPTASKSLTPAQKAQYCSFLAPPHNASPSKTIKITPIADKAHPAYGQSGLFARTKIAANTFILDYTGHIHTEAESDPTSDYDLSLSREEGLSIDAARSGTEARFINDYRGVGQRANVEFRMRSTVIEGKQRTRMGIWTLRDVKRGEELLLSYGRGFWKERMKGHENEL